MPCNIQKLFNEYIRSIIVVLDISSAKPQFISSTLDTITMKCNVPGVTPMQYTVQIWSNATKTWRDTRCSHDNANGSCVVRTLNAKVTVTGLAPGHAYYFRFVSPSLESSQVSESMVTKQLGKVLSRIICDLFRLILKRWIKSKDLIFLPTTCGGSNLN